MLRYGLPGKIVHDQRREFENDLFSHLSFYCSIKRLKTTPYHPQTNDPTEHMNQTILLMLKGTLSGLRRFLATESLLKTVRNAFYFTLKALFVLQIFKILSWLFGHVTKRLDKKGWVNFKFYDVTTWLTNNCNTHIAQYLNK